MVRRKGILFLLVVSLVVIAAPAFANHDKGDGQESCNTGEICLYDLKTSTRYTNQFWWDAVYGSHYNWWDTWVNQYVGYVINDMSAAVNRDTKCDVRFADWETGATWQIANDFYWHEAPSYINQAADAHTRVDCRN